MGISIRSGIQYAIAIQLAFGLSAHAQQRPERVPQIEEPRVKSTAGPVTAAPTTAPTAKPGDDQPLPAVAIEVQGSVEWAAAGVPVLGRDGWSLVKVNDVLAPATQVRTGLRSSINLKFGETTYISLRSATHASIEQCYRSAKAEVVRMGLGYGTVRGGSSEGEIRSDVVIDSTVATLAKRGTEGWQIEVEPVTGRFQISLAEFGLVEARQKLAAAGRTSREVRPGEYASDANIANLWIKQDIFNRNVTFFDSHQVTESDAEYSAENTRGYTVMAPGAGTSTVAYSGRASAEFVRDQLEGRAPGNPPDIAVVEPGTLNRPEGNFGTANVFRVRLAREARASAPDKRSFRVSR